MADGLMVEASGSGRVDAWTFDMVQDRLVEALLTCWRLPDRERGWQRQASKDGPWSLVMPEPGDYDARGGEHSSSDVPLKPASLTRVEVAEMEEAFGWMRFIADRDRRLVALALRELARGARRVEWRRLLAAMGLERGSDGLRMRYGRAIAAIAGGLNARSSAAPAFCKGE